MTDLDLLVTNRRIDIERTFAAATFRDPGRAVEDCGWIDPRLIRDERIRRYWTGVLGGKDTMQAALDAGIQTDILGWMTGEIFEYGYDARPFAKALAEEVWFYTLATSVPELAKSIASRDLEGAQRIVSNLASDTPRAADQIPNSTDIGLEFVASLDDENVTIPTGIPTLDRALGGLWRQNQIVICARPSVGKTALAWQVIRNLAAAGHRVLFISLEMGKRNVWARAVCGVARIPYRDVLAKRITEDQRESIIRINEQLMERYNDLILIDDAATQTTSEVWRKTAALKPDVVVVDHLRLLSDAKDGDTETKRQGRISWKLKQIAKEFNIPVIALAQLNRGLESREDKHPTLSDLRDSGEIEENADFVLGLHRDREYLEAQLAKEKTPADLTVLKFRDGPSDILIRLTFDGLGQWFEAKER